MKFLFYFIILLQKSQGFVVCFLLIFHGGGDEELPRQLKKTAEKNLCRLCDYSNSVK